MQDADDTMKLLVGLRLRKRLTVGNGWVFIPLWLPLFDHVAVSCTYGGARGSCAVKPPAAFLATP
jgi:hypothetical protein